jgi:hypothetical protein
LLYVRDIIPKSHCLKPAQEVIQVTKNLITILRQHLKECKNSVCLSVCQPAIKTCEKVVEKCTACVDACMGSGSDQDAKEVCQDCHQACKDCIKACNECLGKACS